MKILSSVCVWTSVLFAALLTTMHWVDTSVDPSWQPISEYSLGSYGILMRLAFIALGTSMASLAIALWQAVPRISMRIAACMLFAAAAGNLLAAIVDTDPAGTPAEQLSLSGQIHAGCAGMMAFFILATLVISWQFFRVGGLKPFALRVLLATIMVWVCEIVLVVSMANYLSQTKGVIGPDTPFGWQARIFLASCAIWLLVLGRTLQKSHPLPES